MNIRESLFKALDNLVKEEVELDEAMLDRKKIAKAVKSRADFRKADDYQAMVPKINQELTKADMKIFVGDVKVINSILNIIKEEIELDEVSQELATRAYGRRARDAFEYGDSGDNKEMDKSYDKSQKSLSIIKKKYGKDGVDKANQQSSGLVWGGKKPYKEEVELDEVKSDVYHQHMLKALGKTRLPKDHPYTSAIANNGDFVVHKSGNVVGRIPKGEHKLGEETDSSSKDATVKSTKANVTKDTTATTPYDVKPLRVKMAQFRKLY
jgi:hypothetical protein